MDVGVLPARKDHAAMMAQYSGPPSPPSKHASRNSNTAPPAARSTPPQTHPISASPPVSPPPRPQRHDLPRKGKEKKTNDDFYENDDDLKFSSSSHHQNLHQNHVRYGDDDEGDYARRGNLGEFDDHENWPSSLTSSMAVGQERNKHCAPRARAKNRRVVLGVDGEEDVLQMDDAFDEAKHAHLPQLHQLVLQQDVGGVRRMLSSTAHLVSQQNRRTGATALHVCALLPSSHSPSSTPRVPGSSIGSKLFGGGGDQLAQPRDVIADLLLDVAFESGIVGQVLFAVCRDPTAAALGVSKPRQGGAGETALHIAARSGFDGFIMKVFERIFKLRREEAAAGASSPLDWDAFVNAENGKGQTALHLAAKAGQYDCCMTLVANGAAVDWEDIHQRTAYDLALHRSHSEVVKLLRIEGATIPKLYQNPQQLSEDEKANLVLDDYGWIINGDPERGPTPRSGIKDPPVAKYSSTKKTEKQHRLDAKRTKKWEKMLKHWDTHEKDKEKRKKKWKKVQKRARKGIPPQIRGQAWIRLTGAHHSIENPPIKYNPDKTGSRFLKQIDLDIARTHREHILYKVRYSEKQCQLFRLLRAYSLYNKAVGYTQGMSSLAAMLLTFTDSEEEAFWTFDSLMKNYGMSDLYRPGFPGLKKDFYIHEQLMRHFLPRLHEHFESEGVITSAYATKWFLMIFMNLPYPTTIRLWDYVFCEGYKAIFFVAISLLQELEDELLRLGMERIFLLLGTELSYRPLNPDHIIRRAVKLRRKAKKNNYALFRQIEEQYARNELPT